MADIPVTDAPIHKALNALVLIEKAKTRAEKVDILNSLADNQVARWMFAVDCPSNRRLGIRVGDEDSRTYAGTALPNEMEKRFKLLQDIVDRLLNNDMCKLEAKEQLESLLKSCSYTNVFYEGVWYTRLINHGMRLGLTASSIADVWPELRMKSTLPYARSILNAEGTVSSNKVSRIHFPCVAEPIIGGVMASIVVTPSESYTTAFGGRRLTTTQIWADAVSKALKECPPMVVNGEFIAKKTDEGTVRKGAKERALFLCREGLLDASNTCADAAKNELVFVAYDAYTLDSLRTGIFKLKYGSQDSTEFCRSHIVQSVVKRVANEGLSIMQADQIVCDDLKDLEEAHKVHIAQGYAGTIIKPCTAPILFKPSDCLFKWKDTKNKLGYILSVYAMKDTVGMEVFVPETNGSVHISIPTRALKDWCHLHSDSLQGYAVDFTEITTDSGVYRALAKLRSDKQPLPDVQMFSIGQRFGVDTSPVSRMPQKQFSSAASLLTVSESEYDED